MAAPVALGPARLVAQRGLVLFAVVPDHVPAGFRSNVDVMRHLQRLAAFGEAAMFVTATGNANVITHEHMPRLATADQATARRLRRGPRD
jgi:hypothetical protein